MKFFTNTKERLSALALRLALRLVRRLSAHAWKPDLQRAEDGFQCYRRNTLKEIEKYRRDAERLSKLAAKYEVALVEIVRLKHYRDGIEAQNVASAALRDSSPMLGLANPAYQPRRDSDVGLCRHCEGKGYTEPSWNFPGSTKCHDCDGTGIVDSANSPVSHG